MRTLISDLLLLILCLNNSEGQAIEKKTYTASRISSPPVINRNLDDEAWQGQGWTGEFVHYEPFEGALPTQKSDFKLYFDNDFIYVAIRAFDTEPDSIVDRLTRRDNISGDNVAVVFDSYFDQRTGFCFQVSSAGVKADYILVNDGEAEDKTWDPVWYVKTARFDEGWCAEMKIPVNQLRFKADSGAHWGFMVARMVFRNREMSFWQPVPRNAPGFIQLLLAWIGFIGNIGSRLLCDGD